jgi:hypothetical protein
VNNTDLGFVAAEVGVECLGDTLVCTGFYASVFGIVSTEKGQGRYGQTKR